MTSGIIAMIVGTGRFGRNYGRILSRLNRHPRPGIPPIHRLVVTRTTASRARELAETLSRDPENAVPEVIGCRVANPTDLTRAVDRYLPEFTCIVASDPVLGDAIHPDYARDALRVGRVLCEKPFCPAAGNGKSLARVDALRNSGRAGRFGLELPMAAVRAHIAAVPEIEARFKNLRSVEFYWGSRNLSGRNLIDSLALHPFSLIPPHLIPKNLKTTQEPGRVRVTGILAGPDGKGKRRFRMLLYADSDFRGFKIDDALFGLRSREAEVLLLPLSTDPDRAIEGGNASLSGTPLLRVEDPLARNIEAALAGRPLVDIEGTRAAQLFLERIHGYAPP